MLMGRAVKITLGTFALTEAKARLGGDVAAGVRAALADFASRLETGPTPIGIPRLCRELSRPQPATSVELQVEEGTWTALEREAAKQGATVGELAAHSVLVYLAELDRLTPPRGVRVA